MPVDEAGPGSTKRSAPEGTFAREADAGSKMHSTTSIVPKALIPETSETVTKVEMSAATIAALRAMMRDETKNGLVEVEHRLANELDRAPDDIKEELKAETAARPQLEERIVHFEQNSSRKTTPQWMLAVRKELTKQWLSWADLWTRLLRKLRQW